MESRSPATADADAARDAAPAAAAAGARPSPAESAGRPPSLSSPHAPLSSPAGWDVGPGVDPGPREALATTPHEAHAADPHEARAAPGVSFEEGFARFRSTVPGRSYAFF